MLRASLNSLLCAFVTISILVSWGLEEAEAQEGTLGTLFQAELRNLACEKAADVDDSGTLDITDAVYLLRFLFLAAPQPPAPYPECGSDNSLDSLSCESFGACL